MNEAALAMYVFVVAMPLWFGVVALLGIGKELQRIASALEARDVSE